MKHLFVLPVVLATLLAKEVSCFHIGQTDQRNKSRPSLRLSPHSVEGGSDDAASRRRWIAGMIGASWMGVTTGALTAANAEDTKWMTGKMPIVPGQKVKDKNDVSGTRKDPNFLRSLSDCKNQCERTTTSDGYAKSKEDCLSECQDICCSTYQQCTFAIVPRI